MHGDSQYRPSGQSPLRRSLHSRWDKLTRSGFVTVAGLLVTLALCGVLWIAHVRGRIHKLTTAQEIPEQAAPAASLGGQDLVHLSRFEVGGSLLPEFTGSTLAPGYGMLLLQATLSLPGRGEIPIVLGTAAADLNNDGQQVVGGEFSVRAEGLEYGRGTGPLELVAARPASQQDSIAMPGGSRLEAHFSPDISRPTGGVLHTGIETTTAASISTRGLELSISAKNNNTVPRHLVMGWQSRFLAPQAGLQGLSVQPILSPASRATSHTDLQLGARDLNETYSDLSHGYLSNGPEVLLRNRADGYTLRFRALTPTIRSLHVQASRHDNSVLLGFSTAAAINPAEGSVLAPGESMQWRLRIEAVPNTDSPQAP